MQPIANVGTTEIALLKPSWRSGVHELRAGEELVGRLDLSAWSNAALAETADGAWRFERPRGILRRRIRILDGPDGSEAAVFERRGRGGGLGLDGGAYDLRADGWIRPTWSWTGPDGETLVRLGRGGGLGERKGVLALTEAGTRDAHAGLLLLLAAHVALVTDRETGATAGAGAATGGAAASG